VVATSVSSADTPHADEPSRFLHQALSRLRWATVAALLLLTLLQPMTGRFGMPSWSLLLLFAAYNTLGQWLQTRWPALQSSAPQAILDLLVAGLIYFLGAQPGGPPFVLVVLAVVCAAVSLSLRGTLFSTVAAVIMVAAIAPTLPMWSPTAGHAHELGARLVSLALIGVGSTILARHVTLEHAAARASRDEAEHLAELDRLRASFIETISHDLQTPLAAMRASLGLLDASAGDRLQMEERDLLNSARRNNQYLGLLIDDLRALNQLEAGTLRLDLQLLDLRAVIVEALGTMHPLLEDKGQDLEVDLPATPMRVAGDARQLGQVVTNLLHNAHRHTPPGTRVVVRARRLNDEARLSVSDNGPGIAAADVEVIFRRFHHLSSQVAGSGLGLAIARELVERHGGRVWVESQPGEGSTFYISLPCVSEESSCDVEVADR
jgi:signal transduction histidine kinase